MEAGVAGEVTTASPGGGGVEDGLGALSEDAQAPKTGLEARATYLAPARYDTSTPWSTSSRCSTEALTPTSGARALRKACHGASTFPRLGTDHARLHHLRPALTSSPHLSPELKQGLLFVV